MSPKQHQRVGFYLRVSTSGQTVENQRIDLERVAAQRGWQVIGEYVDHGISGTKGRDKRPEFDRLARDAAQGKLDLVAAWSIDRIGRNLGDLVTFTNDLRQQGVGIYLHQQQVDTSTAAGRAFLQMAGVFAEFERAIIVERTLDGLAAARRAGKKLGRPIGKSAPAHARVAELRASGRTWPEVAQRLRCTVGSARRALDRGLPKSGARRATSRPSSAVVFRRAPPFTRSNLPQRRRRRRAHREPRQEHLARRVVRRDPLSGSHSGGASPSFQGAAREAGDVLPSVGRRTRKDAMGVQLGLNGARET